MSEDQPKFWFPAKRYGWGWGLANCWQGGGVQVGYIALLFAGAKIFLPQHRREFWILMLVSTAVLIAIHWFKGEKPLAWRWGK
ncbi:hypothetical protein ACFPN2_15630 [Steroidobacter flavus]|uniref:Uncharacterized protein n=1 Tax=Steroidobacter flavus TaxID=1842136 RepID=A0ABV8SSV5_9GAMM